MYLRKSKRSKCKKFLNMYIENHCVSRTIRLRRAKCLLRNQVKNLCNKNDIDITEASVNDHRAIGMAERLIQTFKSRLASSKEEKLAKILLNKKEQSVSKLILVENLTLR